MPKKYPPLTEEEKRQILSRHRELVDRMNQTLPDEMKLRYDEGLAARLEEEKEVAIYRIGLEMEEKRAQQKRICDELEGRFGAPERNSGNPLTRAIYLAMDTSGTEQANAYNEKLYQDYLQDPGKIVYMRYGDLMKVNPKAIYDCGDDPLKLAEYYRDTYPQCEEAFNFSSVINNGKATPAMKQALASMTKPMETISYPVTMVKSATGLDYFACPKMTPEQAAIVQQGDRDLMAQSGETLRYITTNSLVQGTMDSPCTFFGKFVDRGIDLKSGMFVENRPETFELDADGNPTNIREVGYDRLFDAQPGDNVRLSPRPAENLRQVEAVNTTYQRAYQQRWQAIFNQKRGYNGEFDIKQIETQHQGGFFERYIRHSTSTQYSEYLQAFKDFHNPESPNYLNEDNLRTKGEAYLQRKRDQGYPNIDDLKGTSLIRAKFVMASLEACNATHKQDVESTLLGDYSNFAERTTFLTAEDVAEDSLEEGVDVNELANHLSLEDEIDLDQTI